MIRKCPSCGAKNRVPPERLHQSPACGQCKGPLGSLDHPVAFSHERGFDEFVAGATLPVLVDFWAPWCGPCRIVGPELEKLAKKHAGKLVVAKLNTEDVPAVAQRFQISSIPTMVLFRNGAEAQRLSGAMAAKDIEAALGL